MDPAIKKQVLRQFTYGLFAITCSEGEEVNAFTANWLTQVSFDPPLLAVSVENNSKSLPMIQRSRKFAVNILHTGTEQRKLAGTLGKSALKYPDKLVSIAYETRGDGYIVLRDVLSWVGCVVQQTHPAGDSTLLVAEVVDVGIITEGQPLTMNEAGFRHAG
ncbi:MAG TPA: flavin reductase family protein [Ktedonobacteraceae bacterium]|nr:flavin reductase family protein [Ktedonobacteraceae bacterium]